MNKYFSLFQLEYSTILNVKVFIKCMHIYFVRNFIMNVDLFEKYFLLLLIRTKIVYKLKYKTRVDHGGSGRRMEVWTNQPGVQFYTGNFLRGQRGKMGVDYVRHSAFCLETQNFPDAVNHVSLE